MEEIKSWDIISIGKLHREISQGKYSERELATKIYEQNNELRKIKTLLDKYSVDMEDLSQLEDILKDYDKWQLELDEIMNKGTCGFCKMKHDRLQEENKELKDTVDILRGILRVDENDNFIEYRETNGIREE